MERLQPVMENVRFNNKIMKFKKIYFRIASLVIITIILLSNTSIGSWLMDSYFGMDFYAYSNGDGTSTFWCGSFKDKPYPDISTLSTTKVDTRVNGATKPVGAELRETYPNADTIIYRLFSRNPILFWRWGQYLFGDPKYKFPYKSWEEIKAHRPKNFKRSNQWQQF